VARASLSVSHICRCILTMKSELKSDFPRCAYVTLVGTNSYSLVYESDSAGNDSYWLLY
jgi:hypothetical protein